MEIKVTVIRQKTEDPKWWRYLARFLLCLTIADFLLYIYIGSRRIIFGVTFGESLGFSFLSVSSYTALLGLVLLAVIGLVFGFVLLGLFLSIR